MKNTLKGILEAFQGANGDVKLLLEEMNELAHHFFFGGYYQVNNRKIYLRDIEFYYHEEGEGAKIKDYIMYHISDKIKDPTMKNEYYPLGSFNAHVSGVDFTFENKKKEYRASILIRGIKVIDKDSKPIIESRPTYVYDGSLVMGNLMLAAHAEGIGSCWIHRAKEEFESAEGKAFLKSLGIEGDYEGIGHCVLGYTDGEEPKAMPRKENYVYCVK